MKIDRITFTGADDSINPFEMIAASKSWPIIEWGILFSRSQQGCYRFPSREWLNRLNDVTHEYPRMALSAHLCGAYVRDFVINAKFTWPQHHSTAEFQRVQLNFHGQFHKMHEDFPQLLKLMPSTRFIFQCDGINDNQARAMAAAGLCVPLFDVSGGAGLVPDQWPKVWDGIYCGYAGGLGPGRMKEQLRRIEDVVGSATIWIDMERQIRSEDDSKIDLSKIGQVLLETETFL